MQSARGSEPRQRNRPMDLRTCDSQMRSHSWEKFNLRHGLNLKVSHGRYQSSSSVRAAIEPLYERIILCIVKMLSNAKEEKKKKKKKKDEDCLD